MILKAKIIIDGAVQSVSVKGEHVVYFFRDEDSALVRLRLIDGSEAVTDLRLARVTEIVTAKS